MALKQFFIQFKALAWKNAILKWRYVFVLLLEIAIPTLILLALGAIKNAVKPEFTDANMPTTMYWNENFEGLYTSVQSTPCTGESLVWRCVERYPCNPITDFNNTCQPRHIAVAPKV